MIVYVNCYLAGQAEPLQFATTGQHAEECLVSFKAAKMRAWITEIAYLHPTAFAVGSVPAEESNYANR